YLPPVLPGLAPSGEERTSPSTAQALPAWVIGSRFLGGLPSRMIARETIAHAPSSRWLFARKDCALHTASSPGFTPASAGADSACRASVVSTSGEEPIGRNSEDSFHEPSLS